MDGTTRLLGARVAPRLAQDFALTARARDGLSTSDALRSLVAAYVRGDIDADGRALTGGRTPTTQPQELPDAR
jgi:hypothetical protein